MKIRTRLMLAFACCGLVPIIIVGFISYRTAVQGMDKIEDASAAGLSERAQMQLVALRDVKKTQVEQYCDDLQGELTAVIANVESLQRTAHATLDSIQTGKKADIEADFHNLFDGTQILAHSTNAKTLFEKLKEYHDTTHAQDDQPLDVSTPEYKQIVTTCGGFLHEYADMQNCGDAYVICAAHGHVMFTVGGLADTGSNLAAGPGKNEGLARLWQRIRESKQHEMVDFAPYTPAGNKWVAFVGQPICNEAGDLLGILALQLTSDRFDRIVNKRVGLGTTGESYLVGSDLGQTTYRSNRVITAGKIGEQKTSEDIELALAGKTGRLERLDGDGDLKVSYYSPLDIPGLKWALITSVRIDELLSPRTEGKDDYFTQFTKAAGYYDLFLLDRHGYCFYSVCHEPDYRTNMVDGPYKDSNFGVMTRKILSTKDFAFADFAPYAPSNGEQAAFIGVPVLNNGEVELIVALQIPKDRINQIMTSRAGLGETGFTYLIGLNANNKTAFRCDLTAMDPKYVIGYEITTPYIEEAFQKEDAVGQGVWKDSKGQDVIAAYTRVKFFDANWGLFGKINGTEAFVAVNEITTLSNSAARSMLAWSAGVCLVAGLVVLAVGYFVAMKIVRPLQNTTAMLKDIAEGEGDLTRTLDETSRDELGEMAHWFNVFVGKLRGLIANVAGNSRSLDHASSELSATATQLAGGAEETTRQATNVASATEEMSTNMNSMSAATEEMTVNIKTVAAATEQMTASVTEIARNAEHASSVANGAAELARVSNETISKLGTSADEIGKVIDVIQDIADQTNLLALNATIEAARAGAAGSGFAVVATEVKELARKTAEATEDIRRRIEGIQTSSTEAVQAISQISQVIEQVKDVSRTIASAVEEQTITTREIAQTIAETSKAADTVSVGVTQSAVASTEISKNISGVDDAARQTAQGAAQTQSAGENLLQLATELSALVGRFKT